MTHCTGQWLVVVVVCLSGIKTAELLNCTETVEKNGSALYKISEPAELHCETDWAINGIVVAYEGHVNKTLVQLLTQDSLRLIHRYPNVTYTVDCEKGRVSVPCYGPASSSLREPPHDANNRSRGLAFNTTDSASSSLSEAPHDANKLNWGTILAIVVIALLVIALLFILPVGICWRKKKRFPCRCFRKEKKEQGDPKATEGML
ncbi:uncharacterized protein LOC116222396 [Clupea harengus]|uniref:Uncharacterized protein LOC116222396 n=1 Tax=Clupea harengus TaxID=7950 RepID=A0A6P8G7D1_CLUHA|nr:uncharacterized protein LOC116222396 [Clupea harengus]